MPLFRHPVFCCFTVMSLSLSAAVTLAQMPSMPPVIESSRPQLKGEFRLYPGTAPGSQAGALAEQWDTMEGFAMARNVTEPTLIPVLPDPARATGTAVVVAPGGAYMALAMDTEGLMVARALAARGVAAFVLKYRLDPTPRDVPGFEQAIGARMSAVFQAGGNGAPPIFQPLAIDDAAAALKLIRLRASEWHIDPNRVGMVGFSAGAMTTLTLTLEDRPGARPNFIGVIYGPMVAVRVPPQAPPMFAALASDDPLFGHEGFGLIESWQKAGRPVELHFYERGDHGFGMRTLGTTSDMWFEEFATWMKDRRLLDRP